MKSQNWSERLDAKILDSMKQVPPLPLWLLLAMQGVAVTICITLFALM